MPISSELLSFYFIIFQPNPSAGRVTYWADGEEHKKTMRISDFIEVVLELNDMSIYSKIVEACNTYSFYMWSAPDKKVIQLFCSVSEEDAKKWPDSLFNIFKMAKIDINSASSFLAMMKMRGEAKKKAIQSKQPFEQLLDFYGFDVPNYDLIPSLTKELSLHGALNPKDK